MAKSPISRIGGKYFLANKIIPIIPEHYRYIEPFGGAMHVLFKKKPSEIEVYNDIDSGLVNFFRVVKNNPEQLIKKLEFTLYSREVFSEALKNMNAADDMERACNFYIVNRQCFGGKMTSWGVGKADRRLVDHENRIREAYERIRLVHIENLDWRKIIQRYDGENSFFLVDPPYMFNECRGKTKLYKNEMSEGDHMELVESLKGIKGKFLLCGYKNDLYDCFERVSLGENNIIISKKVGEKRLKKEEFVWKNY